MNINLFEEIVVMENEIIVDEVQNVLTEEEVIVDEEETIDEIQEIVKEDEVETHEILTEEVFVEEEKTVEVVVKEQNLPKLNYEYCRANGITKSDIKRFWEKIDFPDDLVEGCCEWNAGKDKGYGRFRFAGSVGFAHRFSHMIFKGEIGEGLFVRHKYDNPGCVNPHHLLVGTPQDNMDDKVNRDRQTSGEDVWMAKLTEIEVDEILIQLILKVSKKILATQYEVCIDTIYKISIGKIWKHCYKKLSVDQQQQLEDNREQQREDTWTAKLTEDDVDKILEQLLQKVSVKSLAIQYNVSESNLRNISVGRIWKKSYAKLTVEQKQKIKENLKGLSSDDTKRIRELYKTMSQVKLAKQFKVSIPTIVKVIKRIPPYDY